MRLFALAAVLAAVTMAPTLATAAPVRTAAGQVEGTVEDGLTVYRGVPFAAPPIADLRWRAPQTAAPWTGVLKADKFAPGCMQSQAMNRDMGFGDIPVSEDCLYLNVWAPANPTGKPLPVMVWIYGGSFTSGATSLSLYNGDSLAKKGVIVVSVAYRLGPFGFLAHPELSAESGHGSGNFGLMDQIAALQWVRRNISAFGGDPNRVTIFGESAGGISVSMLAASPLAKGLFQGAISQSGGSFAPAESGGAEAGENMPTLALAESRGTAFLKALGAPSIAQARRLPADVVLKGEVPGSPSNPFWPAADGHVLLGDQYRLYEAGKYNDTPILIGSNSDEGAVFSPSATAAGYITTVKAGFGDHADNVLASYPAGEALRSTRDLFRDSAFAWPTWAWARLQSRTGKGKVFVYYFAHRPPYPALPRFADWGASHGAEQGYVFGHLRAPVLTAQDRATSETLQTYWTNFARTGDPNGGALPAWPAFNEARQMVMRFDETPNVAPIPNLDKLQTLEAYYAWRRAQAGAK